MTSQNMSQHRHSVSATTENPSTNSQNAQQPHHTAMERFSWVINQEVIIAALFTTCLFLICREIKHSGIFLANWNP